MSIIHDAIKKTEESKSSTTTAEPNGNQGETQTHSAKREPVNLVRIFILLGLIIIGLGVIGYRYVYPYITKRISKTTQTPKSPLELLSPQKDQNLQKLIGSGKSAYEIGQLEHALKMFQEALLKEPENSEVLNNIGMVYRKKGNESEALKYYQLAIEKNSGCAECYNNMGVVYSRQNNSRQAAKAFIKAMSADLKYADPHFNYAVLLESEGNIEEALVQYDKFLKLGSETRGEYLETVSQHIDELKGM